MRCINNVIHNNTTNLATTVPRPHQIFLDLCDEELGEPLRQSALLTGEDHLQHVTMELLHHHKHFLRGLKHALQVHNAQVT